MRSAKRQLRLLTTCLAPRHQARSLVCRSRFSTTCRGTKAEPHLSLGFSTTCAASPAQHGLRAQARLSTNDPSRIPARYRLL
jgi:hypothetical protein